MFLVGFITQASKVLILYLLLLIELFYSRRFTDHLDNRYEFPPKICYVIYDKAESVYYRGIKHQKVRWKSRFFTHFEVF